MVIVVRSVFCSMRGAFSCVGFLFFFFKQKTAYEMRISDWSSDVCSSDLKHSQSAGHANLRDRRSRDDDRKHAAVSDGTGDGGLTQFFPRSLGARFAALISG